MYYRQSLQEGLTYPPYVPNCNDQANFKTLMISKYHITDQKKVEGLNLIFGCYDYKISTFFSTYSLIPINLLTTNMTIIWLLV